MRPFGFSWLAFLILGAPAAISAYFADNPHYHYYHETDAALVVSFKHTTPRIHECTPEEMKAFLAGLAWKPKHMQKAGLSCGSRERHNLDLLVKVDGRTVHEKATVPSGWRHDASVFLFEKFMVGAGPHKVEVYVRDTGAAGADYPYAYTEVIDFPPLGVVAVDFQKPSFVLHR